MKAQIRRIDAYNALVSTLKRAVDLGLTPWFMATVAVAALLLVHLTSGALDRGSILTLAGLVLAIVAVTVGLMAVAAQHLAETYTRSLLHALFQQSTWRTAAIAEGVGLVAIVGLAFWRPDVTTGIAAMVVLVASLIASWNGVQLLLRHFDPLSLIKLQSDVARDRLQRDSDKAAAARQPSQAILSLILGGAAKGDTDVVEGGLAAWNTILKTYVTFVTLAWYDEYLYWLYPRCQELIEQHATDSVGLVLPSIVDGVVALGVTTASYRNPLNNDFDEGTWLFVDALKNVVRLAEPRSARPLVRRLPWG